MNTISEIEAPTEQGWENIDSPEKNIEAAARLNEIIEDLESRMSGKELVKFLRYELQEILAGRLNPSDAKVIHEDDFKTILYAPNLRKKEISLIVWGIALRAGKLLTASEARVRAQKTQALKDLRHR